jgi:hypothetical protein
MVNVGDFVTFRQTGKLITGEVVSLHPEEGRGYIVVAQFTPSGRLSTSERRRKYVNMQDADKLMVVGRRSP